jgi:arginase
MDVQLILVPYDSAQHRWRMGLGPERLIDAGLESHLAAQGHRVAKFVATLDPPHAEIRTAFELMGIVAGQVRQALAQGRFPLVLSGNCNTAPGTLAGLTPASRGIFWFDAHGDCNTPETTLTGYLDGMGCAVALGWCWRGLAAALPGFHAVQAEHALLLGVRDLDPPEADLIAASALTALAPADLRRARLGAELARLKPQVGAAYLHCDLDVFDPSEGRANNLPVPGGLSAAEVEGLIREIGQAVPVKAAAVTAYAPEYDADGRVARAAFRLVDAIVAAAATA